jgi:hypothetical protein
LVRDYFVALGNAATAAGREAEASGEERRNDALVALNQQANRAWQRALRRPAPTPT